jgi:nicotinamidase-related amidase
MDPASTALVFVGFQNEYFSPEGARLAAELEGYGSRIIEVDARHGLNAFSTALLDRLGLPGLAER